MACWTGKPDAGELVCGGVMSNAGLEVAGLLLAVAASCAGLMGASAIGSFVLFAGDGVSTNIIDGPGASLVATSVRGCGRDVNLGAECSSTAGGWVTILLREVPREDKETWDEELAALCPFWVLFAAFVTAVSDEMAP